MKILFLTQKTEVDEIERFLIESQIHCELILVQSDTAALLKLMSQDLIEVIISDKNDFSFNIFKYLISSHSKIPIILINEDSALPRPFPDLPVLASLTSPKMTEKIIEEIKKIQPLINHPDYIRIHTQLLVKVSPLLSDVFIRLSTGRFVKVFKHGMFFEEEDSKRYLKTKGVDFLYIPKTSAQILFDRVLLLMDKEESFESSVEISEAMHEAIQEFFIIEGFTENLLETTKKTIDLIIKSIRLTPKLNGLIQYIKKDATTNYISKHSILLAHLSCSIAKEMEWSSETTFQKLTLAAFFHDFVLRDDALAKCKSINEAMSKGFNITQVDEFKTHPFRSAQLITRFKEIPPDVDTIITHHHEKSDGSGFPRGLNFNYISPLSANFIIAHDILDELLINPNLNIAEFLKSNEKLYSKGPFKKIINGLDF